MLLSPHRFAFIMKRLLAALLGTLVASAALGQPATISHQGYLESSGVPINGSRTITFSLFDAATGGTEVWKEKKVGVPVTDGIFDVELGIGTSLEGVNLNRALWLQIAVDGDDLFPRSKVTGVPYAHTLQTPATIEDNFAGGTVVSVINPAGSGVSTGLTGETRSGDGRGLMGLASTTSGVNHGVYGETKSTDGGRGVYGLASATTGYAYGVYGETSSLQGLSALFKGGSGVFMVSASGNVPDLVLGANPGTAAADDNGLLSSDRFRPSSDLILHANHSIALHLDQNNDEEDGRLTVVDGTDSIIMAVNESGLITMNGTVDVNGAVIVNGNLEHGSDRNRKENFEDVDVEDILERVVALPITRWQYIGASDSHIGPMAQDFHAAFELGRGETTIATVDADGIALAAIQGLHRENQKLRSEIEELKLLVSQLAAAR
jgi:hypothetical protein